MRMKLALTVLLLGGLLIPPSLLRVHSQRGQGVRIRVEAGQDINLYDESHALVIGVRKYANGWRELPGVERDVEAVSAMLRKQGFQVTVALNPTSAQLKDALSAFISDHGLQERNRLLIYFAGHGHTEELADGRELGYIVPADAPLPDRDPRLFVRHAISMADIEANALRIRSKHAMFVFDSCFSGSIFEVRSERYAPPEIESKTAAPVRLFITSGTKNQTAPDDSVFRLYFVRAFERREGDLNDDGFITGEELGMYLSGRVASDSRDTQTPRYGKIKDARLNLGDIVFALPRRDAQPPAAAPGLDTQARPQAATKTRMSVAGVPLVQMRFKTAEINERGQIIDQRQEQRWGYVDDLGNGVKLEMVEIPAGEFLMGEDEAGSAEFERECARYLSDRMCKERAERATPQRRVRVKGFLMGKYKVTQRQWEAVMGSFPRVMKQVDAKLIGDDLPMIWVGWDDVQAFIQKLGKGYRLPSEAEWEYAARSGTQTAYAFGPAINPTVVNYNGYYTRGQVVSEHGRGRSVAIGSLGWANAWGLYDMHGNVREWCEDDWRENYNGAPSDGRARVDISHRASYHVVRGGAWDDAATHCQSSYRDKWSKNGGFLYIGFRLVRTASGK